MSYAKPLFPPRPKGRYTRQALSALVVACALALPVQQARADFSISIGIDIPTYPQMMVVPGYPVYYDPYADYNYFYYDGLYWVYQDDNWYSSNWYDGPWAYVDPYAVPVYVLRVPVRYYRDPPEYFRDWDYDRAPRWGTRWGQGWVQHRRGWDHWNRGSAPRPAPLPFYQRAYSDGNYPRNVEQQRAISRQNFSQRGGSAPGVGSWREAPRPRGAAYQAQPQTREWQGQQWQQRQNSPQQRPEQGQSWPQQRQEYQHWPQQQQQQPQQGQRWQQRQEYPQSNGGWPQQQRQNPSYPQQSQEWQHHQQPNQQPNQQQWQQRQPQQWQQQQRPQQQPQQWGAPVQHAAPQQQRSQQPSREQPSRGGGEHREGGDDRR